ncbi:dTDP-4-dehydrorhamnose 3,5-epimerase family protein [Stappia taiwanensis]|uniref:dTDP-4-dehydrorhamnose 3,5-epimerase n=1 Tax=Stappia taiwanensis TaxID=992267 RepID=A0A838XUE3_9HYPH|nr:dTDP-4-dehydrorhamnose 3,5-epimerase family protein [Stappia taiwanensis]MBA4612651.1 dTDP-4-dehydrorhamnose 3,5-epimerase family protein [Stappia taiwanensis]GGE88754.1 dTDP-4-dehydrorhamnose 3,5-epimerase [Stappia taiwanensis]
MLSFQATDLQDVVLVETGAHRDERGAFARLYCPEAFAAAGIAFTPSQINLSTNTLRHTLRGLHFQAAPWAEAKFVRVVTGAIYDVVLDLRPDSPSYRRWQAFELSADNLRGLFIPEGCAHGFLTLEDDTGVLYQMGRPYEPGHAAGIRYDDPAFAIDWPAAPVLISRADREWPLFAG